MKLKIVDRYRIRFLLMVFISGITGVKTLAQQSPNLKSFIYATPTAQALGKYGEVPVSLYNGIPNISIPLHTVKARGVELPISLSYHAGGIRVDEIASNVGLGWSLNAGGVITRSIRKTADDLSGVGYFDRRNAIISKSLEYLNTNLLSASSFDLTVPTNGLPPGGDPTWLLSYDNEGDAEPDIFYYNFGGTYSGKFFMDENGDFVSIPQQDISIKITESTPVSVTRWEIRTPDGVRYIFGKTDVETTPVREARETTSTVNFPTIVTGWYLVEVITPYNDYIKLYYESENYSYYFKDSETTNHLVASDPGFPDDRALGPNQKNITLTIHNGVRVTSISSNTSLLSISAGTRDDLPGSFRIERIDIQNSSTRLNKSIDFSYSYFRSSGSGTKPLRLRLDYIEEYAGAGANRISGGKHIFDYNVSENLPNWDPYGKAINSQDLWGYYNGADNSILTQSLKVDVPDGQLLVNGAHRYTSPRYAQANVLYKITYPTGGYTAFDFESNQVFASDKDFLLLNAAPVTKNDHLVIVSNEPRVEKILTLQNPDPITGKISFQTKSWPMVHACPSSGAGYPTCYEIYIEGVAPTVFARAAIKEGIQDFLLDPGTYRISGMTDSGMESIYKVKDAVYHLSVEWQEFPTSASYAVKSNKDIGGLRIVRVTDYSATGNLNIKRYEYNTFGTSTSSGVLVNFPQSYATKFFVIYDPRSFTDGSTTEPSGLVRTAEYLQVRSYPLSPMQATQAGAVGYANVTEYSGEFGENGKTEYTFTTALDYPDIIKNYRPFPQPTSFDWRRGRLKMQSTHLFDNSSGTFKIVKSVENRYTADKNVRNAYGFSFEKKLHTHSTTEGGGITLVADNYYVAGYRLTTEFFFKDKEIIREYSPAGSSTPKETVIDYDYGYSKGHYHLTSKTERNSNNSVLVTTTKYPEDDLTVTLTTDQETARQELVSKFMKSSVLEESVTRDGIALAKTANKYKIFNGIPLLNIIDVQTEANPIEQRIEINNYDNAGNVLRQKKTNDVDNAFIWGYNQSYPIAQVKNALETEIAYTSFETSDPGNWSFSPSQPALVTAVSRTGEKHITIPSGTSISKTGLSATSVYVVSYWSKDGSHTVNSTSGTAGIASNGWTYYEHVITNPSAGTITVTGPGSIDELRLHPKGAQMVTYCYNPAVGISSSTDANNVTTTYEYDLLGRLKVVRDTNQKILKSLVYHYKGE